MQPTFRRLQLHLIPLAFLCSFVAGQDINPVLPADLTQCETSILSWSSVDTDTIYTASIILSDTRGQRLETTLTPLGRLIDQTSVEWDVAFPAGNSVMLRIGVENRTIEYSNAVVIAPGSDRCLPDQYYERIGSHNGMASEHGTGMINGAGMSALSVSFSRAWILLLLLLQSVIVTSKL